MSEILTARLNLEQDVVGRLAQAAYRAQEQARWSGPTLIDAVHQQIDAEAMDESTTHHAKTHMAVAIMTVLRCMVFPQEGEETIFSDLLEMSLRGDAIFKEQVFQAMPGIALLSNEVGLAIDQFELLRLATSLGHSERPSCRVQ